MRYTITISIEAEQDLSCIYKSIVVNNEVLAKRVLDEFYEKIKSLEFSLIETQSYWRNIK